VQSGSQSSTTSDQVFNTIERKTVGTKLVVTPQINEGDSVLLNIEQEVSSVAQTQAPGTSTLGPTFDTRTIKNAVLVKSGETVVLGGLMDEKTQEKVSKVPLLGDIPVLGYLFRSTSNSTSKRNLMVFIRPTILRDADVYSGISSNKYSQFRSEQQEAAAQEGYLTSPKRQVLPEYGQGVTMFCVSTNNVMEPFFTWVLLKCGGFFVVRQIHHIAMWAFILFTIAHIYLVFYHDYIERNGIASSIIGGWKFVREDLAEEYETEQKQQQQLQKQKDGIANETTEK
jgi:hypothetical protein